MKIKLAEILLFLRPGAEFNVRGDVYEGIEWLDKKQLMPTEDEVEAAFKVYAEAKENERLAAEAKKQALLDKLGLTADEANLLING